MSKLLSFVIPCYRSEFTIEKVVEEIIQTVSQKEEYDYEIICINDCSPDNVIGKLEQLAEQNSKVKVIDFARNMGKHAAVLAGYSIAKGDYIVNLDDDYQSPVHELWQLVDCLERDECDAAIAKYYQKKQSKFKNFGSNVNMLMTDILLEGKPKGVRFENFSVIKDFVCKEMINYKSPYPYLEGLLYRVTNRVKTVDMEERNRDDGLATGFTFRKSLSLWINGLTAFSVKPLRVSSVCGILFAIAGFFYGVFTIIRKLIDPSIMLGYSSMLAVVLFSSGMIMIMLGLIGEYVGRIYICINASPQYVIKRTINV